VHDEVPEISRLRFVTSYPRDFGDDVLEVMRDSERICRYLHAPVQSGSDRILQLMNRGYTSGEYYDFIDRVKAHMPDIMLAGDIIVGFPTETDEDFSATIELLERVRYKNNFIFKYSPRPGTVAYDRITDDVPHEVKRQRNNELLAVQARISEEISRAQIGRTLDVLVEGASKKERKARGDYDDGSVMLTVGGQAPARASTVAADDDADEVQLSGRTDGDQIVVFDGPESLRGRIVSVTITGAAPLTLFGRRTAD
jgi:tRNA-2-methylthio-N6-dimethylallyladenosine synthase